MTGPDLLRKQLERARFENCIDYISQSTPGIKHLNPNELAYLNKVLTGDQDGDPWRTEPMVVELKSGKKLSMSVVLNPVFTARDILSEAFLRASNGNFVDGAVYLYSQMVLQHFFKDGNRRTAVAAVYWLLRERRIEIKPVGLLEVGLGDIRETEQIKTLSRLVEAAIKVSHR